MDWITYIVILSILCNVSRTETETSIVLEKTVPPIISDYPTKLLNTDSERIVETESELLSKSGTFELENGDQITVETTPVIITTELDNWWSHFHSKFGTSKHKTADPVNNRESAELNSTVKSTTNSLITSLKYDTADQIIVETTPGHIMTMSSTWSSKLETADPLIISQKSETADSNTTFKLTTHPQTSSLKSETADKIIVETTPKNIPIQLNTESVLLSKSGTFKLEFADPPITSQKSEIVDSNTFLKLTNDSQTSFETHKPQTTTHKFFYREPEVVDLEYGTEDYYETDEYYDTPDYENNDHSESMLRMTNTSTSSLKFGSADSMKSETTDNSLFSFEFKTTNLIKSTFRTTNTFNSNLEIKSINPSVPKLKVEVNFPSYDYSDEINGIIENNQLYKIPKRHPNYLNKKWNYKIPKKYPNYLNKKTNYKIPKKYPYTMIYSYDDYEDNTFEASSSLNVPLFTESTMKTEATMTTVPVITTQTYEVTTHAIPTEKLETSNSPLFTIKYETFDPKNTIAEFQITNTSMSKGNYQISGYPTTQFDPEDSLISVTKYETANQSSTISAFQTSVSPKSTLPFDTEDSSIATMEYDTTNFSRNTTEFQTTDFVVTRLHSDADDSSNLTMNYKTSSHSSNTIEFQSHSSPNSIFDSDSTTTTTDTTTDTTTFLKSTTEFQTTDFVVTRHHSDADNSSNLSMNHKTSNHASKTTEFQSHSSPNSIFESDDTLIYTLKLDTTDDLMTPMIYETNENNVNSKYPKIIRNRNRKKREVYYFTSQDKYHLNNDIYDDISNDVLDYEPNYPLMKVQNEEKSKNFDHPFRKEKIWKKTPLKNFETPFRNYETSKNFKAPSRKFETPKHFVSEMHNESVMFQDSEVPPCYVMPLRTATTECITYKDEKNCTQRCKFGHTFSEGIYREMKCNLTTNVWKPYGFEECKPFVDCTLYIKHQTYGSIDCTPKDLYTPRTCTVQCFPYRLPHWKWETGKPPTVHSCDINGQWTNPDSFPYCIQVGGAFIREPIPTLKFQTDMDVILERKVQQVEGEMESLRQRKYRQWRDWPGIIH